MLSFLWGTYTANRTANETSDVLSNPEALHEILFDYQILKPSVGSAGNPSQFSPSPLEGVKFEKPEHHAAFLQAMKNHFPRLIDTLYPVEKNEMKHGDISRKIKYAGGLDVRINSVSWATTEVITQILCERLIAYDNILTGRRETKDVPGEDMPDEIRRYIPIQLGRVLLTTDRERRSSLAKDLAIIKARRGRYSHKSVDFELFDKTPNLSPTKN